MPAPQALGSGLPPPGSAPPPAALTTLPSAGANPRKGWSAGLLIGVALVGLVAVAGLGAGGWYFYAARATTLDVDASAPAASSVAPSASALLAAAADAAPPKAVHDAAAPVAIRDAGAVHDAALPPLHIRTLVATSPVYSLDEMNRIIDPQKKALDRCLAVEHLAPKTPPFSFNLTIRVDGTVMNVAGHAGTGAQQCMADQLATMVFPPRKNGPQLATAIIGVSFGP
jgi:hypothetical protein